MNLLDVINRNPDPEPWQEGDNIPWHEPGFSSRMLREHLSQEHDAASRRSAKIERQVSWIHEVLLAGRPTRVLDLGCGPGLYTSRLAELGHRCHGIDYSPASIEHACELARSRGLECTYDQNDVREADFGSGYALVMMLFGELNVFRREAAQATLRKAREALEAGGQLLLEPHTFAAVREIGAQPSSWYAAETGLFADTPHLCLQEHHWSEERSVATIRYYVLDAESLKVERFAQSLQAYRDDGYHELLREAGFINVRFRASLTGSDDETEPGLVVVSAARANR